MSDREAYWVNHARGLEKLLEFRGPESMTSLPELIILESSRPSVIFSALLLRQPTILATPEWKTIPWTFYPERQDFMKTLVDIIADCTQLFALKTESGPIVDDPGKPAAAHVFLQKTYSVLADLERWEQAWTFTSPDQYVELPSPATTPSFSDSNGNTSPIWSTVLQYKSLYHATTATLYHSTLILILKAIRKVSSENDSESSKILQNRSYEAGIAICRSVDYHLDEIRDGIGSLSILFPLKMAFDVVGVSNPAIGAWLRGVLEKISSGSTGRWGAAKHLIELQASFDGYSTPVAVGKEEIITRNI
jgi:hypothetical protein